MNGTSVLENPFRILNTSKYFNFVLSHALIIFFTLLTGEMATTEVSEVKHYAHELDDETTTSDPEMAEMTTMMEENYELEEANPARENLDGPILESSWEEKEVVITNSIDTKCMVRK